MATPRRAFAYALCLSLSGLLGFWNSMAVAQTTPSTAPSAAGNARGETYLLAIGVCPPYRKYIPVEVCRNSVKAIEDALPHALGIKKANVTTLVDEQSSGKNVLATLKDLSSKLGDDDRLILYVLLHGDAFYQWAAAYQQNEAIASVNAAYFDPDEDLMVFWTKEEPTVPALALAQNDWMTVGGFVDAVDAVPGVASLILDSCSSNLFFSSVHERGGKRPMIDFILTSSGAIQASNFDESVNMSLFSAELTKALDIPHARTFGQAVEMARVTTMQHAAGLCSLMTVDAASYSELFPTQPPPSARTHDGKQVSPPLWYCAQVPGVVDYSGVMTNWPLYATPHEEPKN